MSKPDRLMSLNLAGQAVPAGSLSSLLAAGLASLAVVGVFILVDQSGMSSSRHIQARANALSSSVILPPFVLAMKRSERSMGAIPKALEGEQTSRLRRSGQA